MKHLGDITKIDGHSVPIVDIIVGGSPCQDLSVAGKREGLAGQRSGLFMDQIRVIKEMHDECRRADVDIRPRYMVWENVPGAFSSNGGEDFRHVLEETARVSEADAIIPRPTDGWKSAGAIMGDGWSIAWRVHDAQFWGVPQRRKRISLVADFRGGGAPEILFERKSLSRDSEESGETRKESAGDTEDGIGKTIQDAWGGDMFNYRLTGKVVNCLTTNQNATSTKPTVLQAFDAYNQAVTGDKAKSLTNKATDSDHIPCVAIDRAAFNQGENAKYDFSIENELAQTLVARGTCGVCTKEKSVIVRRLTPLECERLQGFPDGWTDIGDWTDSKGRVHKGESDAPRYKALGNSIALPFWEWMAKRMVEVLKADGVERPTMASLFDGIGGFPLVFSRAGCDPVWASEIEEFPVAVTKKHFGGE